MNPRYPTKQNRMELHVQALKRSRMSVLARLQEAYKVVKEYQANGYSDLPGELGRLTGVLEYHLQAAINDLQIDEYSFDNAGTGMRNK